MSSNIVEHQLMTKPSACKYTILSWSSGFNQLWKDIGSCCLESCWPSTLTHPSLALFYLPLIFRSPPKVINPNKFCLKMGLGPWYRQRRIATLWNDSLGGSWDIFLRECKSEPLPCAGPPGHVTTLARRAKAASAGQGRWPAAGRSRARWRACQLACRPEYLVLARQLPFTSTDCD